MLRTNNDLRVLNNYEHLPNHAYNTDNWYHDQFTSNRVTKISKNKTIRYFDILEFAVLKLNIIYVTKLFDFS